MKKVAFKDLRHRTWVSVLLSILAVVLIYFSTQPLIQLFLTLVLTGIILVADFEWMAMIKKKRCQVYPKLIVGFTVLWMLSTYLSVIGYRMMPFNMLIIALFIFFLSTGHFKQIPNAIYSISAGLFGIAYIVIPISLILYIVYPHSIGLTDNGRVWLAFLLVVTKIADIGGYFIGKIWGKHKLAPHLSPKKTIEGALGGLCLSLIASICFFLIGRFLPQMQFSLTLFQSIILGLLLGVLGQLGDLSESLFKRDAQIKDSNTIPGIGGVLDMFDSLIFTIPALYLFLVLV
ncbi:MAG: phosphatidate cytidylyltransferase [Simkaniaceae bacterium]|nr:phosphatidate cytidylyltransferase [Simkaniaceae bacterium]